MVGKPLPLCGAIADNHGMGRRWLLIVTTVLMLEGCSPSDAPPPPAASAADEQGDYDDFHLPLVIQMDVPETPPEIQKPSPPINGQPPEIQKPSHPIKTLLREFLEPSTPAKEKP